MGTSVFISHSCVAAGLPRAMGAYIGANHAPFFCNRRHYHSLICKRSWQALIMFEGRQAAAGPAYILGWAAALIGGRLAIMKELLADALATDRQNATNLYLFSVANCPARYSMSRNWSPAVATSTRVLECSENTSIWEHRFASCFCASFNAFTLPSPYSG